MSSGFFNPPQSEQFEPPEPYRPPTPAPRKAGVPEGERPTGEGPMLWGWVMIVAGAFAIGAGFLQAPTRISYYPDVTVASTLAVPLYVAGGALLNLGVLLLLVAYLVRAIAFLPGRTDMTNGTEVFEAAMPSSRPQTSGE